MTPLKAGTVRAFGSQWKPSTEPPRNVGRHYANSPVDIETPAGSETLAEYQYDDGRKYLEVQTPPPSGIGSWNVSWYQEDLGDGGLVPDRGPTIVTGPGPSALDVM